MLLPGTWLAATPSSAAASAKTLESFQELFREQAGLLILVFVISEALSILAGWIASKAVVRISSNGSILNSLKVHIFYIVALIISISLGYAAFRITENPGAALFAGSVFLVILAFAVPMKIYEIDLLRVIGWIVLTAILYFIANLGVSLALGDALKPIADKLAAAGQPRKKTVDELEAEMAQKQRATTPRPTEQRPPGEARPATDTAALASRFDAQEKIANDKARTQPERMAALTELYKLLEQERLGLPAGDAAARTAFDQRRARYEAILQRLRAEPTPRPKK